MSALRFLNWLGTQCVFVVLAIAGQLVLALPDEPSQISFESRAPRWLVPLLAVFTPLFENGHIPFLLASTIFGFGWLDLLSFGSTGATAGIVFLAWLVTTIIYSNLELSNWKQPGLYVILVATLALLLSFFSGEKIVYILPLSLSTSSIFIVAISNFAAWFSALMPSIRAPNSRFLQQHEAAYGREGRTRELIEYSTAV